MPRYFIEVAYKGANYSGFQVQQNANSIQAEVEKALATYYRQKFELTGSSRTDAGVNARQNFFHFDSDTVIVDGSYHLNAILPADIVAKRIFQVKDEAHARFDALYREYSYYIYQQKDPFKADRAYFYPASLQLHLLQTAADLLAATTHFDSFSKRNTQNKTTICRLVKSGWKIEEGMIIYTVQGNRFLRGMVRGMVGTMLQAGKGKITIDRFQSIIDAKDCTKADFAVPPQGLFLEKVLFPAF